MNKSRKAVLMTLLTEMGAYSSIGIYRSAGEEAAISIALQLIRQATQEQLDEAAARTKKSEPFWTKQW
jgi:hypothetical protein